MIEPKEITVNGRKFIISKISPLVRLKIIVNAINDPVFSILELFKHVAAFDIHGTKFTLVSEGRIELLIEKQSEFIDLLENMLAYNSLTIPKSSPLNHFFDLRFAYEES